MKADLDVEVGQIQEEDGIGADKRTYSGVGQAQEFVKELSHHSDHDLPLVALRFLIWAQDPLLTCATERTTLKST